jgi:hypothetical protein
MVFLNHHPRNAGDPSRSFTYEIYDQKSGTEQNTRNGSVWSILGQYKPQVCQPSLLECHRPAAPGGGGTDAPPAGVPLLGSAVRFSAPFSSLLGLLPQYSSESHLPDILGVLLYGVLICETRSIRLDFFLCVSV